MTEQEFIEWFKKNKEENSQYIGTRKYVDWLHKVADTGKDFPRQDDLEIELIGLYINHYIRMWEIKHKGETFCAEKIFSIRLPHWMKLVENYYNVQI